MLTRTRPIPSNEDGFTLIELVIAIAISGIIIAGLTTGFISAMRGTVGAHDRMVNSNGSHTLATYFTADVQSANPDMVSTDPAALLGCAPASEPSTTATTNLVRMQWYEYTTDTKVTAFSVSYRTVWVDGDAGNVDADGDGSDQDDSDQYKLVRYSCSAEQDPFLGDVAAVLSGANIEENLMVHQLHRPVAAALTTVLITGQDITINVFGALGQSDDAPYDYSFTATMRTPEPVPQVVSMARNSPQNTNAASIAWTVTFNEAVTDVDTGDFGLTDTGALSAFSVTNVVAVTPTTYTVTAATGTGQGTLALTLDDQDDIFSVADNDPIGGAGNGNGNYVGPSYKVDKVAPGVTIVRDAAQAASTGTTPITFTAHFDETVTGFATGDVTNTGTATGVNFTVAGSGQDYTITVTTNPTGNGTVVPSIAAGVLTDTIGNGNGAYTSTDPVTWTGSGPVAATVNIDSVVLSNGGTNNKVDKGDKVAIDFSDRLSVASICSGGSAPWSNDNANQAISGNNQVTVTITNGVSGANDILTVGSSTCALKIGSVDLGSGNYVNSTATFSGNGGNRSTVEWDATNFTLTITLGGLSSGTVTDPYVAGAAAQYTINPAITPSAVGATITGSPKSATGQF